MLAKVNLAVNFSPPPKTFLVQSPSCEVSSNPLMDVGLSNNLGCNKSGLNPY